MHFGADDDMDQDMELMQRAREADLARAERGEPMPEALHVRIGKALCSMWNFLNEPGDRYIARKRHKLSRECALWGAKRLPVWPE